MVGGSKGREVNIRLHAFLNFEWLVATSGSSAETARLHPGASPGGSDWQKTCAGLL